MSETPKRPGLEQRERQWGWLGWAGMTVPTEDEARPWREGGPHPGQVERQTWEEELYSFREVTTGQRHQMKKQWGPESRGRSGLSGGKGCCALRERGGAAAGGEEGRGTG